MDQRFSPHERQVIRLIGRRKIKISDLTDKFSSFIFSKSISPQNYVAAIIRRINQKCDAYELPWTLEGKGAGRGGRTVWRERR